MTGFAFDSNDDVRFVGVSTSPIDFGGGASLQGSFVGTLAGADGSLDWLIGDPSDNAYVAGMFGPAAGANFTIGGAAPITGVGAVDIWVAKISP